jgi:phosphate:Na+ symporter
MIELIALYLAGISFFFTGMAGISDNLRQVTGRRFRLLLSRATNHPVRAGLLGVAAGAVTQSTSVVAFILSGMIAGGLIPLRRALVVLACANIGTAALVFVAAVDLHTQVTWPHSTTPPASSNATSGSCASSLFGYAKICGSAKSRPAASAN